MKFNLFKLNTIIRFLHKQINCGHSFMTPSNRSEVTKIWAILQMFMDNFLGGGSLFFPTYVKFSTIF